MSAPADNSAPPETAPTRSSAPPDSSVPSVDGGLLGLFDTAVSRHPRRIAVTAPDGELTYAELDRRADLVAGHLRRAGVGPDVVVPLLAEAETSLLIGLLAILKAGGGYLPIDPANPPERVRQLIARSGAELVAATTLTRPRLPDLGLPVVVVDDLDPATAPPDGETPKARPHDLAYVIYTSGSTGEPKAVAVEHESVTQLLVTGRSLFDLDENDVWTMFHSAAFDFSVWEIWGAWASAARLVVVPYEVSRSPARFRQLVHDEGVTVLNQTPSAFRQFITADGENPQPLDRLRLVVLGGERLDVAQLKPWFERHPAHSPRLVNMFGITETTVHASYRPIVPGDLDEATISPIGVPLPYLTFHVLDENGDPVPEGRPGELYIGGPGVARGYLHRPDLTAQRFLTLDGGQRVYRTGDRVQGGPDGYAYLGRLDDQLSVRGFRVEPREIEAVLETHPAVAQALVTTSEHTDGDVRLVAHIAASSAVKDDWAQTLTELTTLATASLPRHLRPSGYLPVASIPLTANGKADRSPVPASAFPTVESISTDEDPVRSGISAIWSDTLGGSDFGPDDDFFDVGGTSLSVLRMFDQVNTQFDTDLDLTALLDGVTVAALADEVEKARISRTALTEADHR